MTIQDDFEAGAREYARHLEARDARERREALALEARDQSSAAAFAKFIEDSLAPQHATDTDQEN
jgi:hypothetical protein